MADAPSPLTGAALAAWFGVARQTVSDWKAAGCPFHPGKNGAPTYLPAEVWAWRESARERESIPLDKDAEQVRKLKAEADRVELEVAKVRGELVPVAEFTKALASAQDDTRAAMTSLPSKHARLVVDRTGCTMGVAQTLLADIADSTLAEMQTDDPTYGA
jgi:phage terminase Nu1 subunit (DNA packaging protein)